MNRFISVDWGTSNLRLREVNGKDCFVSKKIEQLQGIKTLCFQNKSGLEPPLFLKSYLLEQIHKTFGELGQLPVLISGMASSNMGLSHLPYAELPINLSLPKLQTKSFMLEGYEVFLISGLATHNDILRGEETQLIGLYQLLQPFGAYTVIIPGTHSKHMFCKDNMLQDFKTYITGEMYHVLSKHSILKSGIRNSEKDDGCWHDFELGLERASKGNLLGNLFSVRVRELLDKVEEKRNYFYLNGLLIGTELSDLLGQPNEKIYVFGGSDLSVFYEKAIKYMLPKVQLTMLSSDSQEQAFVIGQSVIYNSI